MVHDTATMLQWQCYNGRLTESRIWSTEMASFSMTFDDP